MNEAGDNRTKRGGMAIGVLKGFNAQSGGYVVPASGGSDLVVSAADVSNPGGRYPMTGQQVEYDVVDDSDPLRACNVRVIFVYSG